MTKKTAYFLVEKTTGNVLAAHIENGAVLHKWKEDLEKDGHQIEIQKKEVSDIFDGKVGL